MGLVFAGGALAVGGVRRGKGQQSPALNLADGYVGVSEESVELFHEVFADQVRKVYLIEGVAQHGQKNLLTSVVKRLKDWLVHLHEYDFIGDASWES